jgi:hypothetical protein
MGRFELATILEVKENKAGVGPGRGKEAGEPGVGHEFAVGYAELLQSTAVGVQSVEDRVV